MNTTHKNFENLFNDNFGNITNKHVTKNLKISSQSNLKKPNFFVEGKRIFTFDSSTKNKYQIGMKYNVSSSYSKQDEVALIKARKVLQNVSSHWENESFIKSLQNQRNISFQGNILSILAKNELQKYNSNNINFTTPIKSKMWKKIKGGYAFKLGTSIYFVPVSHFKNKKNFLKYRKLLNKVLGISDNFNLMGNRVTSVILQSKRKKSSKTFWKMSKQIVYKNNQQFSKKSKFIVSQKEMKNLTATDSFKKPVNSYNSSYYGKYLVA